MHALLVICCSFNYMARPIVVNPITTIPHVCRVVLMHACRASRPVGCIFEVVSRDSIPRNTARTGAWGVLFGNDGSCGVRVRCSWLDNCTWRTASNIALPVAK